MKRAVLFAAVFVVGCYDMHQSERTPQSPERVHVYDAGPPDTTKPDARGDVTCKDVAELLCGIRRCESDHAFTTDSDPSLTTTYPDRNECLRFVESNCGKIPDRNVRSCYEHPPTSCTGTGTNLLTPECGWVAR